MLVKNGTCAFKSTGRTKYNDKDGRTSQNIFVVSEEICCISLVSKYSQNMASTETSGTEAITAPINELVFEISDIRTIKTAVIANFVRYQVIANNLPMDLMS